MKAGRDLALKVMDVQTVDLPMDMLQRQGDQKKPMKDLRDWAESHRGANEFQGLLNGACALKFWTEKSGKVKPVLRGLKRMLDVIGGFHKIVGTVDHPQRLVRVDKHGVVEEVTLAQIRSWLTDVCPDLLNLKPQVREMLNNPKLLTDKVLENLVPFEGNFDTTRPDFQIHAFGNNAYRVTKEGVVLLTEAERPNFWRKQVADFEFKLLEPFFRYELTLGKDGLLHGTVELLNTECNALRVVVNSSRTAWKEEIDYPHATAEQLREWRALPPRLDAPNLTEKQRKEQTACFLNKVYCIGELMHGYRSPSRARAVMALDYKVGDTANQANGRGGKSFIFDTLLPLAGKSVLTIPSRSVTETNWRFLFGGVTEDTNVVLLEDCGQAVDFSWFFPNITQGMQVEKKGVQAYTIPFDKSPKLVFTTNYVPANDDPSTRDRLITTSFCDYYHADGQEYRERWSIKDDCCMDVGVKNYPEVQRNRDVNFLLQCEQFYLQCVSMTDTAFKGPEGNLRQRRAQQVCGDNLMTYLDEYFGDDAIYNRDISYAEVYNHFQSEMPSKYLPSQIQVTKAIKAYCSAHDIIAIPPEMVTDKTRGTIRRGKNQYFHFKKKEKTQAA